MTSSTDRQELSRIAEALRSSVDFEREMGMTELLRDRSGVEPPPERGEAPRPVAAEAGEAPAPRIVARAPSPVPPTGPSEGALEEGPAAQLAALREEIGDCRRCPLAADRETIVFGEGNPAARLVFVGEGPGYEEDLQGRPFVGPAGKLLTKIIQAIRLTREDVYICNVVKCRPPRNRVPEPEEQQACGAFLERQLEVIRPEVIVCLGATAAGYLLGTDASVGRLRGRFHRRGEAVVMPTYHPAYLLRSPEAKRPVWEDMKLVRDRLGLAP